MNYYDYGTTYGSTYGSSASNAGLAALGIGVIITIMIICLIPAVLEIIGLWKTYTKAGKPGWASIVPFYNSWVLFEIGDVPGPYIFFAFIPFVGSIIFLVFEIKALLKIAEKFGKSTGFGVLSIFFPFITFLILGFSDCEYNGQTSETKSSILDVNENGVPNDSDNASFNYGYENKPEDQVDNNTENN